MLMRNADRNYKPLIITVIIVAILAISGVVVYNLLKSAELSILVAPSTATVKINGKEYTNGQYKFFPQAGVEVEISSPEYQTQTTTIDLLANRTVLLRAVLEDEDGGYESYLQDYDTYNLIKMLEPEVGSTRLTDFIKDTEKKISILNILPINENTGEFYKDQHGFIVSMDDNAATIQVMPSSDDCGVVNCLEIYESNGNIENVRDFLRKKGYNLDDYEYTVNDYYLYDPEYENVD